jgi:D-alanyl-lipoteichoic acid acyltransferase DltB (MBOAT superfamily)
MRSADLLARVIAPLRIALVAALEAQGWPAAAVDAIAELLDFAGVAVVGALMVLVAARMCAADTAPAATQRSAARTVVRSLAAAVAAALLVWMLVNPSAHVGELFTRADHIAFSALVGALLAGASPARRAWALTVLSVAFIWRYCGSVASVITLVTIALSYAALGERDGSVARRKTVALAALGLAAYAVCLWLRRTWFTDGLQTFAILSFVFLRQISAATALSGAPRPPLSNYLCYLTFYPGGFGPLGGPEVYADFARRNLGARLHHDAQRAARGVVWGAVQVWAAYRVPTSTAALFDSTTFLAAWEHSLLMFARAALYSMGVWSMIDATALVHGFRLHPNFRGVLTRQNPSELWWAWRGTLTNWLVRHVYGPLGANQRHQSRNILAAFAVSWLWHVVGVPFIGREFTPLHLAPITLWAAINAAAVIGHVQARQHQLRILPASTPQPLRRGIHMFLTACLGTTSVTLLQFQGGQIDRFVPFLRVLVGLG